MSTINFKSLPTVKLNDGNAIPYVGYGLGTANFGKDATDLVKMAIEKAGYYHIDCAAGYKNSQYVGNAWKSLNVKRDQLWFTTKVMQGDIKATLEDELEKLQTDQVNLWLIHTPISYLESGLGKAWEIMEGLQKEGKAKSIGVSNYRIKDLEETLKTAKVTPAANQIEFHPYVYDVAESLVQFCQQHDITIECYGPLCPITKFKGGPVDEVVEKIAKETGLNEAGVLLKWAKQVSKGVIVTTSTKSERLAEQLDALAAKDLTQEQIDAISTAGKKLHKRAFMQHMDE